MQTLDLLAMLPELVLLTVVCLMLLTAFMSEPEATDDDVFYAPQPYPSWTISAPTWIWQAPTPYPTDGKIYTWDEATLSWVEIIPTPPVETMP